MKKNNKEWGDWGEKQASIFLLKNNYKIITKNFKIRGGEIDIIAWHEKKYLGKTLCFIEVKTRKNDDGSAERSVDNQKIRKIVDTARIFCMQNNIDSSFTPIQFEQISIYVHDKKNFKIFHYEIPF
jgi:putative endonuclease